MLKCVMLIDDNDADLLYTRIVLERSGVANEVLAFESARDALTALSAQPAPDVDLILLDINMPGMNGFDFLRAYELLSAAQRGATVVVMLSSSPDPADRERASTFGCVKDYVVKPLDRDTARALVRLAPH